MTAIIGPHSYIEVMRTSAFTTVFIGTNSGEDLTGPASRTDCPLVSLRITLTPEQSEDLARKLSPKSFTGERSTDALIPFGPCETEQLD